MAEKLALPLLLPNPPPTKPFFQEPTLSTTSPHPSQTQPISISAPSPLTPLVQDYLNPNPFPNSTSAQTHSILRTRRRIGKHQDANKGKPWTDHRLSSLGQQTLSTLIDPQFTVEELNEQLLSLFPSHSRDNPEYCNEAIGYDVLGLIKGLRFYKKCDLALAVFEWFRNHSNLDRFLTNSAVAVLITMLGKERQVSVAASLLHNLHKDGFPLDVYSYTSLISAFASNGRYRDAAMTFKKMEEDGCQPSLISYNVILNVYGKMGMPWSKITAIIESMKNSGVSPDSYTYNTLISCCRRGSLYDEAKGFFEEMKVAGYVPNKVTYNALLDVYGKSRRPQEAMEVLMEMEKNGFTPSIVTYNSLISAYARGGLLEEAMDLKKKIIEKGMKPDVFTYTTLISGFEKSGKDDAAMSVFDEMRSVGCKPNICTFNALIKMYGNRGKFTEMMKIFHDIKECGCTPDIVTWNTLLAVFGQSNWDSDVSGVFKEMKRAGFVAERDTFNTLISAYSRCGSFDQAMVVYKRMLEAGVTPDLSTYNAILAALARGGRWKQAEKVFDEMTDINQCKPNELTYSCLLHAYANGKEITKLHALANEMISAIKPPHPVLLKTLVLVYSKTDLLRETEQTFSELKKTGSQLDITTLNSMVAIYGRRKMISKANEIMEFMKNNGFAPTLATYNSLMYMYSRSESYEKSEEMLRDLLNKGVKPDVISFNTVIYAYCRNGKMREASRILSEMGGLGVVPDVITYNTFVGRYAADAMFVEAKDVICYMIKNGCKPNQSTYNSIVDSYCKLGRKDEAAKFITEIREINPHVSKEEEYRLSERLMNK